MEKRESEDSYNPFVERWLYKDRINRKPLTVIGACINLCKVFLGTGILSMPWAFSRSGLIAGLIGTLITGTICSHCMHLLVVTSQACCKKYHLPVLSFSETTEVVLLYGPESLRKYPKTGKVIVDLSLFLTYAGIVSVYIVFLGETVQRIFVTHFDLHYSVRIIILIIYIPIVVITQLKELKYVVPASIVAFVFLILTFIISFYYILRDGLQIDKDMKLMPNSFVDYPDFFAVVVFSMEAIGIVMPIENRMANAAYFTGCPSILCVAIIIVIFLYSLIGSIGFLKYGSDVKGTLTLNLPDDEIYAQLTQIFISIAVYLTIALNFFVTTEVFWRLFNHHFPENRLKLAHIIYRWALITFVFILALFIPKLEYIMVIISSLFIAFLGLIIPATLHTIYKWDNLGRFNWILYKNGIMIGFAIIGAGSGCYSGVVKLIATYSNNSEV